MVSDATGPASLPEAQGRRVFAISHDMTIVGGGVTIAADGFFEPVHDVHILRPDGSLEALPPLPARHAVAGLSGTRVDDTIVLAAQDCFTGGGEGDLLVCGTRSQVLWTRSSSDGEWTQHVVPDHLTDGIRWEQGDIFTGGTELRIVGSHSRSVTLALEGGPTTRFIRFDLDDESFVAIGDGPRGVTRYGVAPFCADDDGRVIQARIDGSDLTAAILRSDGTWTESAPLAAGTDDAIGSVDVACFSGREPLISAALAEGGPSILATVTDEATLSPIEAAGEHNSTSDSGSEGSGSPADIVGLTSTGDVVARLNGVMQLISRGGVVSELDAPGGSPLASTPFLYGDNVGAVDNTTGVIHL